MNSNHTILILLLCAACAANGGYAQSLTTSEIAPLAVSSTPSPTSGLTLQQAIDEAISKSPGFGVIDAEVDAARGEAQTSLTKPNPELSFGPGWKRVRETDSSHNEFKGTIGFSQIIVFPGKREILSAIGQKNVELKRAGADALRFQIAASVRKAFSELLAAQGILSLRQQQLESAKIFHEATSKRVADSYASDFEAVKSQGEVINAARLLKAAEGRIITAKVELNTLLGRNPSGEIEISGILDTHTTEPDISALVAISLGRNPSLRIQAMQAELAGLNLRKARLSRKPDISVGPTLEYSRSEQILGFSATIPLARKNSNLGEVLSASAEQRRILAETEVLRREITGSVVQAASKLTSARSQLALFTTSYLEQLKAVVAQAEQSHAQSITSLLVYLEAKRSYYDTLASYREAIGDVAISRAELEAAVGCSLENN